MNKKFAKAFIRQVEYVLLEDATTKITLDDKIVIKLSGVTNFWKSSVTSIKVGFLSIDKNGLILTEILLL